MKTISPLLSAAYAVDGKAPPVKKGISGLSAAFFTPAKAVFIYSLWCCYAICDHCKSAVKPYGNGYDVRFRQYHTGIRVA